MKKIISLLLSTFILVLFLSLSAAASSDIVFSLKEENNANVYFRGNTYTVICSIDSGNKGVAAGNFNFTLGTGLEYIDSGFFEDDNIPFDGDFSKVLYGDNAGDYTYIFLKLKDSILQTGRFCFIKFKISDSAPNKTIIKFRGIDLCNSDFNTVTTNISELVLSVENNHNENDIKVEEIIDTDENDIDSDNKDITDDIAEQITFADVDKSYWGYSYIMDLAQKRIVNGVGKNKFSPERNVTRAEFIKILSGLAEINTESYYTEKFSDVNEKDWYMPYIAWAVENDITTGTSDNTFSPNSPVTREQAATLLFRLCKKYSINLTKVNETILFEDNASISSYAQEAVYAMQEAGIINGVGNNRFNPKGNTTRAAACKMISLLIK